MTTRVSLGITTALVTLGVFCWGAGPASAAAVNAATLDPIEFADSLNVDRVVDHLTALQAIADVNGGNRAIGTPGYLKSADYIEALLKDAGYRTERQAFDAVQQTILKYELSLKGVPYLPPIGVPMSGTTGTGPAGVTATIVRPSDAAGAGCTVADWANIAGRGHIAVVNRGGCSFAEKSLAAGAIDALGLVIINTVNEPILGSLGPQDPAFAPTIGVSLSEGTAIASIGDVPLGFTLDEETIVTPTFNLLAETPTGRDDNTVMAGAHLDSVPEGPGINDNGSGSAVLLETALELATEGELNNQVRFAWWGGEEEGLLGSVHYVQDLVANNPAEIPQIATYLNFDMVGSPNPVMAVYDADQSSFPAPVPVPAGSVATEKLFTDYFAANGQPYLDTAFDGRSDYAPFIIAGIPASGLFTGAEGLKSPAEAAVFGGTAGEPYDPNYHSQGDRVDNINTAILGVSTRASGYVIASLALDTSLINGVLPPDASMPPPPVEPAPAPVPVPAPLPAPAPGPPV
ncbi:MAG: Aminopeptidase [Glaciihabitans sp.]|nr:Aminopeptidase [Glaciihabitans sp.]